MADLTSEQQREVERLVANGFAEKAAVEITPPMRAGEVRRFVG
jgi:hypothetical protein